MLYKLIVYFLYCLCKILVVCQNINRTGLCMNPNRPQLTVILVVAFVIFLGGIFSYNQLCQLKSIGTGECMPGYRGVNCSEICPYGYFGRLCKVQCHCSSDMFCEPTAGCLCNTTSLNCTDPEQGVTEAITSDSQDPQAKHYVFEIVSSLVVIVCLVVGSVCIRYIKVQKMKKKRYIKFQKGREESHSTSNVTDFNVKTRFQAVEKSNVTSSDVYNHLNLRVQCPNISLYHSSTADTCTDPVPCSRETLTNTSHLNEEGIHISWHQFDTACKNNKKAFGRTSKHNIQIMEINDQTTDRRKHTYFSLRKYCNTKHQVSNRNQRQHNFCDGSAMFELKQSVYNTASLENKSKKDNVASSVLTHNQDLYVNYDDIGYANCIYGPESPSDSEDSDVYFDVTYEGQLTMSASTDNDYCFQLPFSSETGQEMSDYINCGSII